MVELDTYHLLLVQEARLRKIFTWTSLGGLRRELKARILSEKSLDFLIGSIDHVQSKEDALYFVKQAIPCILHLENLTLLNYFACLFMKV